MEWTNQPPTAPGYYWEASRRGWGESEKEPLVRMIEVDTLIGSDRLFVFRRGYEEAERHSDYFPDQVRLGTMWYGPIEQPAPPDLPPHPKP